MSYIVAGLMKDAHQARGVVLGWNGGFEVIDPEIRSVHQALVSKWVTRHGDEVGGPP